MKLFKQTIIAGALTFAMSNVASAAVLNIAANGTLMGALGVNVDGKLYDVTFRDGTTGSAITAFTNAMSAQLAAAALFDQVLTGDYRSLRLFTNGCNFASYCYILTPYEDRFGQTTSVNTYTNGTIAGTSFYSYLSDRNTDNDGGITIAYWTPHSTVSNVPLPGAYALFLTGTGLLGCLARRRKQNSTV